MSKETGSVFIATWIRSDRKIVWNNCMAWMIFPMPLNSLPLPKLIRPKTCFFFVFGSMLFEKKRHQKIPRVSGLPTFKSRSAPSSFSFCFSWLVEVDFGIEMSYCLSFCVMDDESSVSKVTWCGGGPDLGGYMTNNWGWGNQRFL